MDKGTLIKISDMLSGVTPPGCSYGYTIGYGVYRLQPNERKVFFALLDEIFPGMVDLYNATDSELSQMIDIIETLIEQEKDAEDQGPDRDQEETARIPGGCGKAGPGAG